MSYAQFITSKLAHSQCAGIETSADLGGRYDLFPHQRDLTRWALRRGRAAIFAGTGLGKTRMEVAFAAEVARITGLRALILAPLAVAEQTVAEGAAMGVQVTHVRDGSDPSGPISVTNYDRLHRFDPAQYGAIVLDESSIIKHHDTKTLAALLSAFRDTPYRLAATATPAPNDWAELGTHAEFLGIRSRVEMLSEFFTHDGGDTQVWRLKGHARQSFWRWVASWGALIRSPEDLGHNGDAYQLPPLRVYQHTVASEPGTNGEWLFPAEALTLSERRSARRDSLLERAKACALKVNDSADTWVIWCELNAEADALKSMIHGSVEIRGTDEESSKERRLADFAAGKIRVLITKPSIAGWGLNWQHCHRIGFVGVTDSFESYYQAVRRCWRFGQRHPVEVHLFASEREGAVVTNLRRKEQAAEDLARDLSRETLAAVRESVLGSSKESNPYLPSHRMQLPSFIGARA